MIILFLHTNIYIVYSSTYKLITQLESEREPQQVQTSFSPYMSDTEVKVVGNLEPFKEVIEDTISGGVQLKKDAAQVEPVHIRVQQRNGRKSLTTVQGIPEKFEKKKILKALKKDFCCNGTVVNDPELGQVIFKFLKLKIQLKMKVLQLQGDQRKNVSQFLVQVIN